MKRDFKTYRIGTMEIAEVISRSSLVPKDAEVRGVISSGALVSMGGSLRLFGKVGVDFKNEHRPGSWIRSSRVVRRVTLPHLGTNWTFVTTKNSNYIVQMQEGTPADGQE